MGFAGRHVMIDAYVANPDVLRDKARLDRMLQELSCILDMQIIFGPHTEVVPEDPAKLKLPDFVDSGGLSGFAIISTSHMSYHAWPLDSFISLDIYSCRDFDAGAAIGFVQRELQVTYCRTENVVRQRPLRPIMDFISLGQLTV